MKIEIEFTSSYSASLIIDGKKMSVESKPGMTTLKGITSPKTENTLGGIIACEIYGKIAQFQQAWAEASEIDVDCTTWSKLSEEAAEAASDRIW
jgi:hypothetical protein